MDFQVNTSKQALAVFHEAGLVQTQSMLTLKKERVCLNSEGTYSVNLT